MAAKPKIAAAVPLAGVASGSLNLEEQLHRIEAMGKRVEAHIQFLCQTARQPGTSLEVKDRVVNAFYREMVLIEKQLGRIDDELRLE